MRVLNTEKMSCEHVRHSDMDGAEFEYDLPWRVFWHDRAEEGEQVFDLEVDNKSAKTRVNYWDNHRHASDTLQYYY